jgi:hypothetical protein
MRAMEELELERGMYNPFYKYTPDMMSDMLIFKDA